MDEIRKVKQGWTTHNKALRFQTWEGRGSAGGFLCSKKLLKSCKFKSLSDFFRESIQS